MTMLEIKLDNLEELARKLDAFHAESDGWYFRGQAKRDWKLLPSVWRDNKDLFEKFCSQMKPETMESLKGKVVKQLNNPELKNLDTDIAIQWVLRVKFENLLLSMFYYDANNAGLPVPDIQLKKCKIYNKIFWMNDDLREIGSVFNLYANRLETGHRIAGILLFDGTLPQHYGLPTRYMDWTTNPRIAAFFAGYEYLKFNDADKAGVTEIAIYAIKDGPGYGSIQIENHHSRYKNKFLHMQSSVFTRTHGDFYFLENGKWPAIEDFYEKYGDEFFELKKYILDVKYVESLMAGLKRQGISIASLMPSFTHVAEQIRIDIANLNSTR